MIQSFLGKNINSGGGLVAFRVAYASDGALLIFTDKVEGGILELDDEESKILVEYILTIMGGEDDGDDESEEN